MFKGEVGKDCQNCDPGQYRTTNDVDSTKCIACSSGFSQQQSGQTSCLPCLPGEYQNETKQTSCIPCARNTKSTQPHSTDCDTCKEGEKSEKGSAKCMKCDAGEAGTPCQSCNTGQYRSGVMSPKLCLNCPKGWSSDEGSTKCRTCDKGTFNPTAGEPCKECPVDTYQELAEQFACTDCPRGYTTTNNKGQSLCLSRNWVSVDDCNENEYLDDRSGNKQDKWKCKSCPLGGACAGPVRWDNLGPLFGWWKVPEDGREGNSADENYLMFSKCIYLPACLGAPNVKLENEYYNDNRSIDFATISTPYTNTTTTTCATHLAFRNDSRLCHACDSNSRRQGIARCDACPSCGLMV